MFNKKLKLEITIQELEVIMSALYTQEEAIKKMMPHKSRPFIKSLDQEHRDFLKLTQKQIKKLRKFL